MKFSQYFLLFFVLLALSCSNDIDEQNEFIEPKSEQLKNVTASGSFSVLTYNVAGLPGFISGGDPAKNTATIGRLTNNYDIVHVQEDFNYHSTLYRYARHPHRTSTSGGVPFGDGMNTMSKFSFQDFRRVKWNSCNGADCLTPKGFTVARHRIAEGVFIDFYNAHPNAGSSGKDKSARRSNIKQLRDFINRFSDGNAVILMGDMNCRYTRRDDNIRELNNSGLKDVWVQLIKGGNAPAIGAPALVCDKNTIYNDPQCEIVDKIFYRSSRFINLSARYFSYEENTFRDGNGKMLSDHRPIVARFNWSVNNTFQLSDQFGGPHGNSFTDINSIPSRPTVQRIFLHAGKRLDQVGIRFKNGKTIAHGGNGGNYRSLDLRQGEYVKEVVLYKGKKGRRTRIFRAEFKTNQGRVLAGGKKTGSSKRFVAPAGYQIAGFHGRAGSEIDRLGVIYAPK